MKTLHISIDSQFVQVFSQNFSDSAKSDYAIISNKNIDDKLYNGNVRKINLGLRGIVELLAISRSYDAIIAHGLGIHAILTFLFVSKKTIMTWCGWGYDYYSEMDDSLLSSETFEAYNKITIKKHEDKIINKSYNFIYEHLKANAIKNVNFFSAPIPNDYSVMKAKYPYFSGEYVQTNYGSLNNVFSIGGSNIVGTNVLIGNSASYTNNHLDAFNILKRVVPNNIDIITPLSYGDKTYQEIVIKSGEHLFGDKFKPLTDFMPLADYSEIINSCNVVIMPHKRQQALGNIGSAMFKGARIVLDKQNPVFDFFSKKGAIISSLDELSSLDFTIPLSQKEIEINRSILYGFWGDDIVKQNTINLNDKINNKYNQMKSERK